MPDGKLTVTLSVEHMQVIGAALENAPYKLAAPVLAEMQRQINEQNNPPASEAKGPLSGDDQLG